MLELTVNVLVVICSIVVFVFFTLMYIDIKKSTNNTIKLCENKGVVTRRINKEQTSDYPTPYYGMNGEILGYLESDTLFRKRVIEEMNKRKQICP